MKEANKGIWEKNTDYTEAWEEDRREALFNRIMRAAETLIRVGAALFARCGAVGIIEKAISRQIQDPEYMSVEIAAALALIVSGVILHVWAELEEAKEGGE